MESKYLFHQLWPYGVLTIPRTDEIISFLELQNFLSNLIFILLKLLWCILFLVWEITRLRSVETRLISSRVETGLISNLLTYLFFFFFWKTKTKNSILPIDGIFPTLVTCLFYAKKEILHSLLSSFMSSFAVTTAIYWVSTVCPLQYSCLENSTVAQMVKNPPAIWETWVRSLGWGDPLESTATHSSILAWRIPMAGGAWQAMPMGSQTVRHDWVTLGLPGGSVSKESACSAEDLGSIPWLGRYLGEENGKPFQYPCLENAMDRGGWWAVVHGITKSRAWLSSWLLYNFTLYTIYLHCLPGTVSQLLYLARTKQTKSLPLLWCFSPSEADRQ